MEQSFSRPCDDNHSTIQFTSPLSSSFTNPETAQKRLDDENIEKDKIHSNSDSMIDASTSDASILLTIHSELYNMGKALTCPLCLSTLRDPILLPCLHAFCKSCITVSLSPDRAVGSKSKKRKKKPSFACGFGRKCPICKMECSKRGMVSSEQLSDLVKGYKLSLRSFGFAPIVFGNGLGMTQIEEDYTFLNEEMDEKKDKKEVNITTSLESGIDKEGCNGGLLNSKTLAGKKRGRDIIDKDASKNDDDNTSFKKRNVIKMPPSLQQCHEHLEVSRAVHKVLKSVVSTVNKDDSKSSIKHQPSLPLDKATRSRRSKGVSSSVIKSAREDMSSKNVERRRLEHLLKEQERVIEVDEKALVRAAVSRQKRPVSDRTVHDSDDNNHDDNNVLNDTHDANTTEIDDIAATKPPNSSNILEDFSNVETTSFLQEGSQEHKSMIDTSISDTGKAFNKRTSSKSAKLSETKVNLNNTSLSILDESSIVIHDGKTVKKKRAWHNRYDISYQDGSGDGQTLISTLREKNPSMKQNNDLEFLTAEDENSNLDDNNINTGKLTFFQNESTKCKNQLLSMTTSQQLYEEAMDEAREREAIDRSNESKLEEEESGSFTCKDSQRNDFEDTYFSAESQNASQTNKWSQVGKQTNDSSNLKVGTIIRVQARTWPGVNKPGGVARISKVHDRTEVGTKYDVTYILGGKEKFVDSVFISKHEENKGSFISPQKHHYSGDESKIERPCRRSARQSLESNKTTQSSQKSTEAQEIKKNKKKKTKITKFLGSTDKENKDPKTVKMQKPSSIPNVKNGMDTSKNNEIHDLSTPKRGIGHRSCYTEQTSTPATVDSSSDRSMNGYDLGENEITMSEKKTKSNLSLSEISQFVKERYRTIIVGTTHTNSNPRKKHTINVVTSSLSEYDQNLVVILSSEMRAKGVTIRVSKDVTSKKSSVCITSASPTSDKATLEAKHRTLKTMRASLAGLPILTPSWISACLRQHKIIEPTEDTWIHTLPPKSQELLETPKGFFPGDGRSAVHGVLASAAKHQNFPESQPLLKNFNVFLCGPWNNYDQKKVDVQLLLRDAGATILTTSSQVLKSLKSMVGPDKNNSSLVLLVDNTRSDKKCGVSQKMEKLFFDSLPKLGPRASGCVSPVLIVNSNWLFDSISCASVLPINRYKPLSPRAKSMWSALH